MSLLEVLFAAFLLAMFAQGAISIYLSLYIWESPERIDESASPKEYSRPKTSFTILIPARHEQAVIGETVRTISQINYPKELVEIFVICESSDTETIAAVRKVIRKEHIKHVKIKTFSNGPINKPHGLNVGLKAATKQSIVIFDAEDHVHPDILNIANTIFKTRKADIIQAGVQLMNYQSRWFSAHNVLEYYFWFKSRMHFNASVGMVPLGGNTVFFMTEQLRMIGGWDEACLTEDAEIGIRMSVQGAKIVVTYDPTHVTQEETPDSVQQFIKQRTRWNQGFIQVLRNGDWKNYDSAFKRVFCLYTLAFPVFQSLLFVVTPLLLIAGFMTKLPLLLSLFSITPIMLVIIQIVMSCVALYEFTDEQSIKRSWYTFPWLVITFFPYQILLSFGALRATYREIIGRNNWEKTDHSGAHRLIERDSEIAIGMTT